MAINIFSYKLGRFLRTIKYLKFSQIYFRVLYKLWFRVPKTVKIPKKSLFKAKTVWPDKKQTMVDESSFVFLNNTQNLDIAKEWEIRNVPLLWIYNLHYFDGLQSPLTPERTKEYIVRNWIEVNTNSRGIGWQPYPLSLRIVNWIKWDWLKDDNPIDGFRKSLAIQISHLFSNLEFHLLGNHLLENAKALIFGGCYFDGPLADKWLSKGLEILDLQLKEQVLEDGGHFELSPMYHIIIFELVLDILALSKNDNAPSALQIRYDRLYKIASKMSSWLLTMVHPDGKIPYFNDSANNLALSPKEIQRYWESLGGVLEERINNTNKYRYLSNSGYIRIENFDAVIFFDVAEIGPSYIPGHGHADALSVELTLFGNRVFGNLGTSVYGDGERRAYERSTAAHSTLEFDNLSSSEIWGGFRVGRRAEVQNVSITSSEDHVHAQAEHNGYKYLKGQPTHKRIIELSAGVLCITDDLVESEHRGIVRYHLHPSVKCVLSSEDQGRFILEDGCVIKWAVCSAKCSIVTSKYADEFGLLTETTSLELIQDTSKSSLSIHW